MKRKQIKKFSGRKFKFSNATRLLHKKGNSVKPHARREFSHNLKRKAKYGNNQENFQLIDNARQSPIFNSVVRNLSHSDSLSRVCDNRRKRRRAIFALSRQGSGHKSPKWNAESRIKCK